MRVWTAKFRGRLLAAGMVGMVGLASTVMAQEIPDGSPVGDALKKATASANKLVAIADKDRTFANTVNAIDDLITQIDTDAGMTQFMAHVSTDAKERAAGQLAEQHVADWRTEFMKREDVYKAVKSFAETKPKLDPVQQKLTSEILREFRRNGMELSKEKRDEVMKLEKEIIRLGLEFEKNIREDATKVPLTKAELEGMPDDWFANVPKSGDIYLVGMDYPTYVPLQEMCKNETTRAKTWIAYKRRAGKKNIELIEQIIGLRAQVAQTLGYASTADYQTETRMSKNAKAVMDFYEKLRPIVRKKAELDLKEFTAAKREETKDADAKLMPWDQVYYENYLRKTKYAVDSEKVKEYFPMEAVVNGLFGVTQSLYGIEYRDITAKASSKGRPLWHPDVKLFEVWDKASNQLLGEFYIDLYPRENKYSHAACWGLVSRKKMADGTIQKPLAALVCNFPKPTGDKPALVPHGDVETFFHEFGHCLHNILTEADYGSFAGTSVARDFVEAPSQMFENWVWDAAVLKTFAKHYKTGAAIPDELVQGMIKGKHLGSGMFVERQFFYGLVDMSFHGTKDGKVDTTAVQARLAAEVEQYAAIPETYFHAGFGHLIGYQAGYYGYMWSLVYASDMFQRFKELGMLSPEAGMYYRKKILARGSTMDELEMVKDYLGREPNMEAFLKHLGLN
ncbi:MAG: M3 family metallopeptidase [Phycisphaerae bacterium]